MQFDYTVTLVVAWSQDRIIGRNNALPWHLPADLQHFKRLTWGKPIIMGRKTFASIGRPLPGRHNIVLSRSGIDLGAPVSCVQSMEQALVVAATHLNKECEVMVIGGAQVYAASLAYASKLVVTEIHHQFSGDTRFPELGADWVEVARIAQAADHMNPYAFDLVTLRRGTAAAKPS